MTETKLAGTADAARPLSLGELFLGFMTIGVLGFGGVLALARRVIVERRRWLTDAEFTTIFSLCQFLPGGNVVNMAGVVGDRFHGPVGAVVSFTGLIAPTFAIFVALGSLHSAYGGIPGIEGAVAGVACVAGGMTLATGLKMAMRLWRRPRPAVVMAMVFLAIDALRLALFWVLLALIPLNTAIGFLAARRR